MEYTHFIYVLCLCATLLQITLSRKIRHGRSHRAHHLMQDINVEGFLKNFGYMDQIPAGIMGDALVKVDDRDVQVAHAIRKFQHFYGLPETGMADRRTVRWMKKPRCGVSDTTLTRKKRSYPSRYTHLGTKWDNNRLTWKLTRPTHKLRLTDQKNAIYKAFKIWEKVTPLSITETAGKPDMEIFFARGEHGDGNANAFDGKSLVLAHAFGPGKQDISGDAHFDNDEEWTLKAGQGSDFLVVAAHEFGHSLGIGHSRDKNALMFPAYQSQDDLKLGYDDIRAIQLLYGSRGVDNGPYTARPPRVTPRPWTPRPRTRRPYRTRPTVPRPRPTTPAPRTTTTPTTTTTPPPCNIAFDAVVEGPQRSYFALQKGQVFKFNENGLDSEYPKMVAEVFEGAPAEFDLAFSIGRTSRVYIVKDNQAWRYTNMELDEGYPLEFEREKFPEDPKFTISLLDDRRRSRVIMFGERFWWFYDFDGGSDSKARPYGYSIGSNWRGVPSGVKYSVRGQDNNYYLVTPNSHVKFDHNRRVASREGEVDGLPQWLDRTCAAISAHSSGNHHTYSAVSMATILFGWMVTRH